MTVRVDIAPGMLEWAGSRSRRSWGELHERFPRLEEWVSGERQPTLKQLEHFARGTYTPVGYFFLEEPPEESLPLPDFRTIPNAERGTASPNLLDTIALCEQRQDWYRQHQVAEGEEPLDFVGSLDLGTDVTDAAEQIRNTTGFGLEVRREASSWSDAFRAFRDRVEDAGVLVMVSGVVGSNTHRKLDPEEFRGFALVDDLAPLVFVNGVDSRAAQVFTLAHELAHVWLGQTALSNPRLDLRQSDQAIERWCNAVAAEFLVPGEVLRREFDPETPLPEELQRLARDFRVSTLVVLRRIFDLDRLSWDQYRLAYERELETIAEHTPARPGGSFYNTQSVRVSKRFARALVVDTLEGRTLYRDAFELLGIKKQATFDGLSERLGVM